MTLLVALKAGDGLVLAADSRGTFGDPRNVTAQNDSQQKAHVLAPHVAALQAGAGELGTHIVQRMRETLSGQLVVTAQPEGMAFPGAAQAAPRLVPASDQPALTQANVAQDGVTPIMALLRDVSRACYAEWFPSVAAVPAPAAAQSGQVATRPGLEFIVAGYELQGAEPGEARIYSLSSLLDFAPALHEYGFATAGVATYALYLLNRLYQPGRSVDELTALAVYVITETASQDGKVGGPVSVVRVSPFSGCVLLEAAQVQAILADNEKRSAALRDSFYEHGDADRT